MKNNTFFLVLMFIFLFQEIPVTSQNVNNKEELENIRTQLSNIKRMNQNDHQKLSTWVESNKTLITNNHTAIDSLNTLSLARQEKIKATTDSLAQLNKKILSKQKEQANNLHHLKNILILSGTVILITFILFLVIIISYLKRVENNLADLLSVHGELNLEKFEELNSNVKKRTKETQEIVHEAFNKTHKQVKKIRKKK